MSIVRLRFIAFDNPILPPELGFVKYAIPSLLYIQAKWLRPHRRPEENSGGWYNKRTASPGIAVFLG